MQEMIIRAVLGGVIVSGFALLGDVLKPKSFAGLFGAAPSVALVTLSLTVHTHGATYARVEAKSMLLGAIAFFVYAAVARLLDDAAEMGGPAGHASCTRRLAGSRA